MHSADKQAGKPEPLTMEMLAKMQGSLRYYGEPSKWRKKRKTSPWHVPFEPEIAPWYPVVGEPPQEKEEEGWWRERPQDYIKEEKPKKRQRRQKEVEEEHDVKRRKPKKVEEEHDVKRKPRKFDL